MSRPRRLTPPAFTPDAGANLAGSRIQQLEKAGFKHEKWVEPEQLHRRIPHLTKSIVGGVLVEGDGWALPWRITRAFYEQAVKLGAEFRTPVSVQSLDYVGNIGRSRLMLASWRRIM